MIGMKRKFVVFLLIAGVFFSSGCYSFRKKFIRKKKTEDKAEVYVNFKEYSKELSPQAYIDNYLFVKGWIDDLVRTIDKGDSFKRKKKAIEEIIKNLEQMMQFLNQEGKDEVYPLYEDFLEVQDQIYRDPYMSAITKIAEIRKIEQLRRRFEADWNYSDVQKWMAR